MMDTYEMAFKKACEKFSALKNEGNIPSMNILSEERKIAIYAIDDSFFFPYCELKQGDACLVFDVNDERQVKFWTGKKWTSYECHIGTDSGSDNRFIKKLGYNILDDEDLK